MRFVSQCHERASLYTVLKMSISARDEERCDGVERPVDDSVHRRLETSECSTSKSCKRRLMAWLAMQQCQTKISCRRRCERDNDELATCD